MTAAELAATLRTEQHDYANAKQRDQLRRDIERGLTDEKRRELEDAEAKARAFDRMMRQV